MMTLRMPYKETHMDASAPQANVDPVRQGYPEQQLAQDTIEIDKLKESFQQRLMLANLRTEAVRAGMIDLDGLKLIDTSSVHLDQNDNVVEGQRIMAELRRNKPWLFAAVSSSSETLAPTSQPVRQKMALEMTEKEYIAARTALTKYNY